MERCFGIIIRCALLGFFLFCATNSGLAGDSLAYTGKYSSIDKKAAADDEVTLEIVQTAASLEVTQTYKGKPNTNRYPFDGSEGDYVTPSGIRGKCKAQVKGKQLILEWWVAVQPSGSARPVREHTRERWQLSGDARILTIQTDVDFPDFPSGISAAIAGDTSGKEKYARVSDH
jgi:hypothetical protein